MTDIEPTPVRTIKSAAARQAERLQRAFQQRSPFAFTDIDDEDGRCATFFAMVPPSYFEFRDRWLGYVVFSQAGALVVANEIRPDYSYREVQTRMEYGDRPIESRILEIFQEIINRG